MVYPNLMIETMRPLQPGYLLGKEPRCACRRPVGKHHLVTSSYWSVRQDSLSLRAVYVDEKMARGNYIYKRFRIISISRLQGVVGCAIAHLEQARTAIRRANSIADVGHRDIGKDRLNGMMPLLRLREGLLMRHYLVRE